jgi:hypothetical protein
MEQWLLRGELTIAYGDCSNAGRIIMKFCIREFSKKIVERFQQHYLLCKA